jgi:hypothetical protein
LIGYRWIQRGGPVADPEVDDTDENHRPDPRSARRFSHVFGDRVNDGATGRILGCRR